MKKFEVRTEHAEIKVNPDKSLSAEEILNAVYSLMDRDPQTIGSFDTLEEAEALFEEAKYKCDTHLYHYVTYFLGVDIVFIEENIYDDEDDSYIIDGGDIWKSFSIPYVSKAEAERE